MTTLDFNLFQSQYEAEIMKIRNEITSLSFDSREKEMAIVKLEEAGFWLNKIVYKIKEK